MDEQKLIHDPSQKVLAMYQAVIEFINEGCDINTLKVADITGRAGIGKGTAYEYFSSKEEIISSAILYYVKVCFEKLQVISTDNRTFQQKINEVMDCIVEEGVREGLIREKNVFLRRAAVETQLSVYFMYRIAAEKKIELDLEADFLREYVYQNLLKLLG